MVNCAQIHKSVATIVYRGPSCTLYCRGKLPWAVCLLHCVPAIWANLYKGNPTACKWTNGLKTCPSQLGLCSYIIICIFTDQSEWLYSDQSVLFGSIKQWRFGVFICIEMKQLGTEGRYSSLDKPASSLPQGSTLWIFIKGCISLARAPKSATARPPCPGCLNSATSQLLFHNNVVLQLSCLTAMLLHSWAIS